MRWFGGRCPSRRSGFVSLGRRLNPCRAVTVRVCVVHTLLNPVSRYRARVVYPRFRVLYQQSAIPYVAVRVFSCVGTISVFESADEH